MTVGIPVYLHYCGGELEEINYVMKADSCCGGEDDHSDEDADNGCCEDEEFLFKSNTDFTLKELNSFKIFKVCANFSSIFLPSFAFTIEPKFNNSFNKNFVPPPKLYSNLIIRTSVLRI